MRSDDDLRDTAGGLPMKIPPQEGNRGSEEGPSSGGEPGRAPKEEHSQMKRRKGKRGEKIGADDTVQNTTARDILKAMPDNTNREDKEQG